MGLVFALAMTLGSAAHAGDLGVWSAARALDADGEGPVPQLDAVFVPLDSVADGVELDEPTAALLAEVREALIELDLRTLHGMLPDEGADGTRHLRLRGDPAPGAWQVAQVPQLSDRSTLGLGAMQFKMSLGANDTDFRRGSPWNVDGYAAAGTGTLAVGDLAHAAEGVLAELERAALTEPLPLLPSVCAAHPEVDGSAEGALMASLHQAFPTVAAGTDALLSIHDVATQDEDRLIVDVDMTLAGGRVAAAGYPAAGAWLDGLRDLLAVKLRLADAQGRTVASGSWRSTDGHIDLRFITRQGALVPWTADGPVPDAVVHLTEPALNLWVDMDIEIRDQGLLVRVEDLRAPVRWRRHDQGARLGLTVPIQPNVEITGSNRAMIWLTEIADTALGLEGAADGFFVAMTQGPDGGGSQVEMRWDDGTALHGTVDAVLLDNALVRFGARILGRHLVPDNPTMADAVRLTGDLLRALDTDYRRVRPILAATP